VNSVTSSDIASRLKQIYDQEYRNWLSKRNDTQGIMGIDPNSGLNMLVERGDWEGAL